MPSLSRVKMKSAAFVRIVARICGDGYLARARVHRSQKELLAHPRKNIIRERFSVRYVNTEQALVKEFIEDCRQVFGRQVVCRISKHEYAVQAKWIYVSLQEQGAGNSLNWRIADVAINGSDLLKRNWLRAFFDDEGHVYQSGIRLSSVNQNGLTQVQGLLRELGIESVLRGPYKDRSKPHCNPIYRICILRENVGHFSRQVSFLHPKKKRLLATAVKRIKNGAAGTFAK